MEIKDSGERTQFDTGAVRDMHTGKGRMDLLLWEALVEVSKHCEEGAMKYGKRNCEKGIPIHSLTDSAFRHLAKYMMGMKDEPHLRAARLLVSCLPFTWKSSTRNFRTYQSDWRIDDGV
ncbi:dATP/dGTP diphosphohydrolase domain-containing protein [Anaerotruncus colihominis]|uniref:dATP/dGTP diphosphohydrolase domain-containing protein n=1 Tax=Anaerotruncus colihominis TaxID=169435 RepID=UPI0018A9D341|nr:dATP/dGTP diphosphohydrolase domain-containing protein [Anaerotruncus colihominis]